MRSKKLIGSLLLLTPLLMACDTGDVKTGTPASSRKISEIVPVDEEDEFIHNCSEEPIEPDVTTAE